MKIKNISPEINSLFNSLITEMIKYSDNTSTLKNEIEYHIKIYA
jgi:hypothetical protein